MVGSDWAQWEAMPAAVSMEECAATPTPLALQKLSQEAYVRSREAVRANTYDSWDNWDEFDPRSKDKGTKVTSPFATVYFALLAFALLALHCRCAC